MLRITLAAFALAAPVVAFAQAAPQPASRAASSAMAKPAKAFQIVDPATVEPTRLLPAPNPAGSSAEALELAQLHQLINGTSAARMEQARWDDSHEDPAIFDGVVGHRLEDLPATWALLLTVANDASLAGGLAKTHFARTRPWGVDATLPNCDAGKGKSPIHSYPSGHSVLGYSVGYALAQLIPARSGAILDRAQDYALSREICGVHFPSDTEASHVIGSLVAAKVLADPRMQSRIVAARTELDRLASR